MANTILDGLSCIIITIDSGFVRCGLEVERKEALAVVLADMAPYLSHSETYTLEEKWGRIHMPKRFSPSKLCNKHNSARKK